MKRSTDSTRCTSRDDLLRKDKVDAFFVGLLLPRKLIEAKSAACLRCSSSSSSLSSFSVTHAVVKPCKPRPTRFFITMPGKLRRKSSHTRAISVSASTFSAALAPCAYRIDFTNSRSAINSPITVLENPRAIAPVTWFSVDPGGHFVSVRQFKGSDQPCLA